MPLFSTTLSSAAVPGASTACNLNWIGGKMTNISVITNSSQGTGDFSIQFTLQDLMRTPSSLVAWQGFSSSPYQIAGAPASHFTSSTIYPDGINIPVEAPLCGVRINSTALSSNTLTLLVVQGEGL
jgi:hypothetical protein